jgi:hypothetical protein
MAEPIGGGPQPKNPWEKTKKKVSAPDGFGRVPRNRQAPAVMPMSRSKISSLQLNVQLISMFTPPHTTTTAGQKRKATTP